MNQRKNWLSLLIPALAESRDAGLKRRPEVLQQQVYEQQACFKQREGVPSAPYTALIPALSITLPHSLHLVNTINLNDSNCRFTTGYKSNL